MRYANFEIVRPLYSLTKNISSPLLKVGDRFIFDGHKSLLFKTNEKPKSGKYLCCDEGGKIVWIDGKVRVTKINGIAFSLRSYSRQFKSEFQKQDSKRNKKTI